MIERKYKDRAASSKCPICGRIQELNYSFFVKESEIDDRYYAGFDTCKNCGERLEKEFKLDPLPTEKTLKEFNFSF